MTIQIEQGRFGRAGSAPKESSASVSASGQVIYPLIGAIPPEFAARVDDIARGTAKIGFWRADLSTGLVHWSRTACAIFDYPYTDGPVNGAAPLKHLHPDDADQLLDVTEFAAREKTGMSCNVRLGRSGLEGYEFIRLEACFRDVADGDGELIGIVAPSALKVVFVRPVESDTQKFRLFGAG